MDNYEFARQLEKRLSGFAKKVAIFCKTVPYSKVVGNYVDQLSRSSSSIGANYIEANESLGKKDFYFRLKVCRKESKESIYWLDILESTSPELGKEIEVLKSEAEEYLRIFSSIINKLGNYKT